MIVAKVIWRSRNDFRALFQCENCGYQDEADGYSDGFFYHTVMPNAICPECGKNSKGENEEELVSRMGRGFWILPPKKEATK